MLTANCEALILQINFVKSHKQFLILYAVWLLLLLMDIWQVVRLHHKNLVQE